MFYFCVPLYNETARNKVIEEYGLVEELKKKTKLFSSIYIFIHLNYYASAGCNRSATANKCDYKNGATTVLNDAELDWPWCIRSAQSIAVIVCVVVVVVVRNARTASALTDQLRTRSRRKNYTHSNTLTSRRAAEKLLWTILCNVRGLTALHGIKKNIQSNISSQFCMFICQFRFFFFFCAIPIADSSMIGNSSLLLMLSTHICALVRV